MPYLWLRYKDVTGTISSRRFNAVSEIDAPTTQRDRGITLRSRRYNHRLAAWQSYSVTISADELYKPAAKAFTDALWISVQAWLSLDTSETVPDDGTFIEFDLPDGDAPYTYVGGSKRLPEMSFTAVAKEPI